MDKPPVDFLPVKEIANQAKKSVRTIKRHIAKLNKEDRTRLTHSINGRLYIHLDFLKIEKTANFSPKQQNSSNTTEKRPKHQINKIEALEAKNNELFQIIKDKDNQLKEKDQLIKQNIEDFKLLTSKVLFLQERNIELQKPVTQEDLKKDIKEQPIKPPSTPEKSDWLTLFLFFGFIFLLLIVLAKSFN